LLVILSKYYFYTWENIENQFVLLFNNIQLCFS